MNRTNHKEPCERIDTDIFRRIAGKINDIIAIHQADGRCRYVSPSIRKVLGYTSRERIGTYFHHYLH
ncbi:MAG TPA: PAS domain-containing protein, partial [Negativicutes bacterium]|nr:PAS domain-containing protein [Negativicutes bacterium]